MRFTSCHFDWISGKQDSFFSITGLSHVKRALVGARRGEGSNHFRRQKRLRERDGRGQPLKDISVM